MCFPLPLCACSAKSVSWFSSEFHPAGTLWYRPKCMLNYCLEPTSDSSLTHLFCCRTSDTRGCTHAFTTRYTTVDAMTGIGTASATVE